MDKKKTIILLWLFTACFALVMPSSLWAQSAVKNLQFCGSDTRNDSVVLFFRLLDDTGKRITSLDEENVKKHLNIFEDGKHVNWDDATVQLVKSGKRIPGDCTFSVLVDLNIPDAGKKQIYEALKDLVESAPDGCVYISFFGDQVGSSLLMTSKNYGQFEALFMQSATLKYFYSAVYSKLIEFNSGKAPGEEDINYGSDYKKNEAIAKRAAAHKGKNYLFIFTECGKIPEIELLSYSDATEYQRDKSHDVPVVYAFYYTGDGQIDEDVRVTLSGITEHEELAQDRRGKYMPSDDLDKVIGSVAEVIEGQMYDYAFIYKAQRESYGGDYKFVAEWNDNIIGKETTLTIGSQERPWVPLGGKKMSIGDILMMGLLALLITLLTIAFFFIVMKVAIPWIKSKTFAAKYYKKYVPEANVQRRVCHYCKQDLQPGQMIVAKCKHVMHLHCWKINNYKCSEYGQNCNVGMQEHVEWDSLLSKRSIRDCKQTIAGIIAGLVSWIVYKLLGSGAVFTALAKPIVKVFYKSEGQVANLFDSCVDKVSSFLAIGLLLGFFLSFVFRYNDEYRNKNWKILLKILGLSLLSGLIGMVAFAIGGCILCALLPIINTTNIPWYCSLPAYLLFSICVSLSLTIKSSVPTKSAMLGGLCSAVIGFVVLYFSRMTSSGMNVLLDFVIYGGGLGASLVTVRALAEKYFLVIQNGVKAGQRIPIHKWMNATGGGKKVTIGMTGECEIQMNWEKSNKVAKEHAKLFIDQVRNVPMLQPLANGVVYNTRVELPVGKPSVLTNGDSFKIGDTIFQYVETD